MKKNQKILMEQDYRFEEENNLFDWAKGIIFPEDIEEAVENDCLFTESADENRSAKGSRANRRRSARKYNGTKKSRWQRDTLYTIDVRRQYRERKQEEKFLSALADTDEAKAVGYAITELTPLIELDRMWLDRLEVDGYEGGFEGFLRMYAPFYEGIDRFWHEEYANTETIIYRIMWLLFTEKCMNHSYIVNGKKIFREYTDLYVADEYGRTVFYLDMSQWDSDQKRKQKSAEMLTSLFPDAILFHEFEWKKVVKDYISVYGN